MHARKEEFSGDVVRTIHELCKVVFNIHNNQEMENIFGISYEGMEKVVHKIVETLPERVFLPGNKKRVHEIKNICAREFIFFQVQEKWNDPQYENNLRSFIRAFSRDIESRV